MSRTLQSTLGVILGLFFCLIVGAFVAGAVSGGGCGCGLASGRFVNVHCSGWSCAMRNTLDTATIDAAGHTIVVAPKYLDVDGKRIATIDANTKSIEVNAARQEIKFIGDGRTIATWRR